MRSSRSDSFKLAPFALIFLILFAWVQKCHSQLYLGQTKAFVIDRNKTSRISLNTDQMLIIEKDGLYQFFSFNPHNDNLCDFWGTEIWRYAKDEYLSSISEDSKYIKTEESTIIVSCKSKPHSETAKADIYSKDGFLTYFYYSDMCGSPDSDKYFVQVESYPHKTK